MVVIVGIGGVVSVLTAVLAMSTGMLKAIESNGRDDRAIVLRQGSTSETASMLSRDAAEIVANAPGIKRGADGKPIASIEVLRSAIVLRKGDDGEMSVLIRGVGPEILALRPEIKIVDGRMFRSGVNELLVGKSARNQFAGTDVGSTLLLGGARWTIVGVFESGGDFHESEFIGDVNTVPSYGQSRAIQSVSVMLESATAFQTYRDALTVNPSIAVDVMRETEFLQRRSESVVVVLVSIVAYLIGGIMAVGAVLAALNTMHSAVRARSGEIAILRAIGFEWMPLVGSVLAEALVLALIGGLCGAALTWLAFNGETVSSGGPDRGQMVFQIAVTPGLIAVGLGWACSIGLIGGLWPALRAVRRPVATMLRET